LEGRRLEEEDNLELVIFDLDGTLVKIPIDYPKMYAQLRKLFGLNADMVRLRQVDELTKDNLDLRRRAFQILTEAEMEALPKLTVNPQTVDFKERFKGLKRALVTLQGRETVDRILPRIPFKFDLVITRENSLDRLEQIRHVIDAFRVCPEKVLVVGDRLNDKVCAEQAGCRFMKVGES